MSKVRRNAWKKDHLKGRSQEEINFLRSLAKIYVKFIIKQAEEQGLSSNIPNRNQ